MQDPALTTPKTSLSWLWALLPLLLAAALAIPLLDVDAFNGDEPASLVAAGIMRSGPWSLEEVLSPVARASPEQALGWPLLLSAWGRFVGWSEVAVRALSLFFGMLTLAWVYRTGRDLLAPRAGLFAALLLSASVFFLAYMIHARAFTLIALCSTLCIWSYWRLVLNPRPTSMGAPAGLLLGSVGLLYSHYFSALFLPALGLFHLLFVPKSRRWWRPVLLIAVAALLAMPAAARFSGRTERYSRRRGSAQPGPLRGCCSRASGSLPEQWPGHAIPALQRAPASRPPACAGARHLARSASRYQDQSHSGCLPLRP